MLGLSAMRALAADIDVQVERNICVVLGCIADKLAGPNSVAVLTEETLDYMLSFLVSDIFQVPNLCTYEILSVLTEETFPSCPC